MSASAAWGQDADTLVLKDDSRQFTVLSQIEDAAERADFLRVVEAKTPAQRCALADAFIGKYPRSWLLAQSYDLLARGWIDLGREAEALAAAKVSLRLAPENPSLLILAANLEAKAQQVEQAVRDAGDALEYLDEIERPPNLTQKEWDALRPQMKAAAYFARARAEISRAPEAALADLDAAVAWDTADAEACYLRAIVELRLKKLDDGVADLAFVARQSDEWRAKAGKILAVVAKQRGMPLDALVKGAGERRVDAKLRRERPAALSGQALLAGYAGQEACRGCHENEWAAWRQTGMAKMLQPYRAENVLGDFSAGAKMAWPEIRVGFEKRPYFEVAADGRWERFYADFTIGSKWQQGYATKLPDGRLQVLPIEYNALQKRWINYWETIDPAGSARAVIGNFPKLTAANSYQQNCAICHTSQLKLERAGTAPLEQAHYREPGVDCEMCHGPSAWHVKQAAKGKWRHDAAAEPPFDFRAASNREGVRVCAQCHQQSAVRQIGENGEMNYAARGNFVPVTWMRPLDAFSRKAFYRDGRFRETTFIVEAFKRSACYRRGAAQCATCHSPHLGDFAQNRTSLKYANQPNEMCLSCHPQYREKVAEHSHHKAGSEASECVSCHMPKIMNAVLFKARSHQIETPAADLTERFGQEESPNACLLCHKDRSAEWAQEQLAGWRR